MTKPCIKCGATDRKPGGDCRPCARASVAAWRKANPNYDTSEKARARSAEYRKAHPEKGRAKVAKWAKANPERVKAAWAKWYKAHPKQAKANRAKWAKANPAAVNAKKHKRRAQKLAAGGSFTATDIKAMLKQQKDKCVVCNTDIATSYHIDHIVPLALDGSNGIQNIQLLCQHCNCSKGARPPIEFMQSNGYLL